jgi:hypothetical protein
VMRRYRWVIAVVAVAAIVGIGWVWLQRDTARPVTIDEARDRFDGSTSTTGPGSSSTTAPEEHDAPDRPAAGVYEYSGSGTAHLSIPPLSQDQGPTIPGTVTHLDGGCWTIRFDYSSNHWQSWTYCPDGADLVENGGESWQRWIIGAAAITNLTTATCEDAPMLPAQREPGQSWDHRCVTTNESVSGEAVSAGPYTFVGEETLDVGGTPVQAAHFRRERTLSGAQSGTEQTDAWFATDTGMPLRNERSLRVETDTPVGHSTYTEDGSFELTSLEPAT